MGAAAAAAAAIGSAEALTGSWMPHIAWPAVAVILGLAGALTAVSTPTPTRAGISRSYGSAKIA